MAFDIDGLARTSSSGNTGAPATWLYASTDTIAVQQASGYFNDATRILKNNDLLDLVDTTNDAFSPGNRVDSATLALVVTLFNVSNNLLQWQNRNGLLSGTPGVIDGSDTTTKVRMEGPVYYQIDGEKFHSAAAEAVLDGAGDDVTAGKFGAWRIELAATGVLTTSSAVASGDMTFDSAEDAMMNLASQARTAGTIDVGYLIIESNDGFTIGTDLPLTGDAHVTAATYIDAFVSVYGSGLNAVLSVATTTPDGVTTLSIGTVDVNINGVTKTQIAAQLTAAFDDADTVAEDGFGGWLLISDHAGTGTYLLAADGIAGSVSAMDEASQAAVDTLLDSLQDLLPLTMSPIARIYFQNTGDGTVPAIWTAGTDDWDDAVIVAANAGSSVDMGIVHDSRSRETFSVLQPALP